MSTVASLFRPLAIAAGCALLVWFVAGLTESRIADARSADLRARLAALVGVERAATITEPLRLPLVLCGNQALVSGTGRGYGGPIGLLIALSPDAGGTVTALTVTGHAETPGIGDFIEAEGADAWLERFLGSSAETFAERSLALDAVAGATITVRGVRRALAAALAADVDFDPRPCNTTGTTS